jgi:hydroxyacylglutathione hydrolase
VPSTLKLEKSTNPFLRANRPEVKSAVKLSESGDAEVFAHIRKAKDNF